MVRKPVDECRLDHVTRSNTFCCCECDAPLCRRTCQCCINLAILVAALVGVVFHLLLPLLTLNQGHSRFFQFPKLSAVIIHLSSLSLLSIPECVCLSTGSQNRVDILTSFISQQLVRWYYFAEVMVSFVNQSTLTQAKR